jgi:hypothetical protein
MNNPEDWAQVVKIPVYPSVGLVEAGTFSHRRLGPIGKARWVLSNRSRSISSTVAWLLWSTF